MNLGRVVLATKNPDKRAELVSVLSLVDAVGEVVDGLVWEDVDETGDTLEANALLKARAVAAATGLAAIADDTGLAVRALGGAPGVHTARYAGPDATYEDNVSALLSELETVDDRAAEFRTAVAVVTPQGEELVVVGALEGTISRYPRGDRGFGYDPVFEVGGRTLAEMTTEEKHAISHRARALRALASELG